MADASPRQEILATLSDFFGAQKANDLSAMLDAFAERGSDEYAVSRRDKSGLQRDFEDMIKNNRYEHVVADISNCEIDVAGDYAVVQPVVFDSPENQSVKCYEMTKEGDGKWRIVHVSNTELPENLHHRSCSRLVDRDIDEVWAMLTEREHLEAWMCNKAVVDLRPGGAFELSGDYVYQHGGGQRIVALEPGRLVTFRWPFDDYDVTVTWRLESHLDMTRIIIEHDMSLDDAKVFLRKRFAQPLDITRLNSLEETYRHDMFAYLELGFAPARASRNPEFPNNLVLELTLPGVSGTQAVAALTEPDHLDAWFEMQEFISWSTYVAADGENTEGEDNVDLAGPFILTPASELAFLKATGGKDEASTLLRGADHRDIEGGGSRREHPGGLPREQHFGADVLPLA